MAVSRLEYSNFNHMKKTFMVIGIIAVLVAAIGAGFVGVAAYKGRRLDRSSKAYVDVALPKIISSWSKVELTNRMYPPMRGTVNPVQLSLVFDKYRLLGLMKNIEGAKGEALITYNTKNGKEVVANYMAKANFANGPANIKISLIRANGMWWITGLHVASASLF